MNSTGIVPAVNVIKDHRPSLLVAVKVMSVDAFCFQRFEKRFCSCIVPAVSLTRQPLDVPVAYSGDINPDAHNDHKGAWAADIFYGDLDGRWTDTLINNTSARQG